jgi:protein-S-isoprenylcysteine O-methyltransferase Ste14
MASSSSPASTHLAVKPRAAHRLIDPLVEFLVRRRILLSAILFVLIVAKNLLQGLKPHDLANLADPYVATGLGLVAAGLGLRSWAAGILRKNAKLTTTGPYALIRNPLYVGSFLMMFGFCALLNNPWDLWFILGPILLLYVVKVRQEERLLARLFPDAWSGYARSTPRFCPWPARVDVRADWRLSQWMRSREYQALFASVAALLALEMWQAFG